MSRKMQPGSRNITVATSFSAAELDAVDQARGALPTGTFLREVVLAALAANPRNPARLRYLPGTEPPPPRKVRQPRDQSGRRRAALAAYRPYHAAGCAARAGSVPLDACTCGGLADGAWERDDGAAVPPAVVFTPPAEREVS